MSNPFLLPITTDCSRCGRDVPGAALRREAAAPRLFAGRLRLIAMTVLILSTFAATGGCKKGEAAPPESPAGHAGHGEEKAGWAITAWGERYGIFAEMPAPAWGNGVEANVHVTVLAGFQPLCRGKVTVRLVGGAAPADSSAEKILRDGIFPVKLQFPRTRECQVLFRIEAEAGTEEIAAGTARFNDNGSPAAFVPARGDVAGTGGGQEMTFLLEQQWKVPFASDWAKEGNLPETLDAQGTIVPPADGSAMLTSPADAVVGAARWPYPGMRVKKNQTILTLTPRMAEVFPRVEQERWRSQRKADLVQLQAELDAARIRLDRLRELQKLGVQRRWEVDDQELRVKTLEARLEGIRSELSAGQDVAGRAFSPSERLSVAAPYDGVVASVSCTRGQFVLNGAPLVHVVRATPVWCELLVPAGMTDLVKNRANRLHVRLSGKEEDQVAVDAKSFRVVTVSPMTRENSGYVPCLIEIDCDVETLSLGSKVQVNVEFPGRRTGVLLPQTAIVDDNGVNVVYVQQSGEKFIRRAVNIVSQQGDAVLVDNLAPGERVVTVGGNSIRRNELMGSGGGSHGHVH